MKSILKIFLFVLGIGIIFTACNKIADLPNYENGIAPVLSSSVTTIISPASDSDNVVLTLLWTNPKYATDSNNVKYIIEIDSTGRNFSKSVKRELSGKSGTSFTGKELNAILLGFGFHFNTSYNIEIRLTSSYANNNDQITSNTIQLSATPYKVAPKVAFPASGRLFIVGDATDFGWTNDATPAFPAEREFTRIGDSAWAGIFNMHGTGGYKLLQTQGDWDTQFHFVSGTDSMGTFEQKNSDPAFPSPAVGTYKVVFDFQFGVFNLTKVDTALSTNSLYITGDGTPSSWTNSPPAAQKFTEITNGIFEITMTFTPGFYYKFLSSNGNWQPQFGGSSTTGGNLEANYGSGNDPSAIPTPPDAGNYKIQVNVLNNSYTVTKL